LGLLWHFDGPDAIRPLMAEAASMGDWRLIPAAANRMPATASYLRRPGDSEFRAFKLDVMRIEAGVIAEITTFNAELFNAFGTRQVATIYTPSSDYQVILESLPEFQADPSGLDKIFLKTNVNTTGGASAPPVGGANAPGGGVGGVGTLGGPSIPLSAVTRIIPSAGSNRANVRNDSTIS